MSVLKWMRLLVGLLLAVAFSYLLFKKIPFANFFSIINGTSISTLFLALIAFCFAYAFRIQRWRLMLQKENLHLTFLACSGPFLGSFALNNILPFRMGDIARAFAFTTRLNVSSGPVLASLLVERLLDLSIVCLLLGIALSFVDVQLGRISELGAFLLIAFALGLIALVRYPIILSFIIKPIGNMTAKISPRLGQRIQQETEKIDTTLRHLAGNKNMPLLVMWSLLAWLTEGGVFYLTALAMPSLDNPLASWLALPVGTLATLIPSSPGYIGTFDYFVAHAMMQLGNAYDASAAYALIVHLLIWIPPTLAGGLYLIRKQFSLTTQLPTPK